ncbi:MAG: CHRD domain-containing protein [Gammaproteobacteria bacterium]
MSLRFTAGRSARLFVAMMACGVAAGASAADTFRIRLTPVPIEASTAAATTGHGSATAELNGTKLTLKGNFTGLKGVATVARVHEGGATGVRGPAIADFMVPAAPNGDFTATLALTAAQAEGVRRGHVYVQIASASAPDGNLWGWLLP